MLKDIQSVSLLDILPGNLLEDAQVYAAAKSLDDELQRVTMACREVLHLPRLDELPEAVLDLLAWQWHVDFYEPVGMDVETKRRLVKKSIAWHRIKGTPAAIEAVASAAFDKTTIKEWYEYGGKPYYFKIITEDVTTDKDVLNRLRRAVDSVKNTRSLLEEIEFLLHLQDKETATERPELSILANKIERHVWRGRYFDGTWTFTPAPALDGTRVHNGLWKYDGVDAGAEDARGQHFDFIGERSFCGTWDFSLGKPSRKILFGSPEADPLSIIEPEFVMAENYKTVLDYGATGRTHDGSWNFGENHIRDESAIEAITRAADRANISEQELNEMAAGIAEIYPLTRIRRMNGTWKFRKPEGFDKSTWFGGEVIFNGLPHLPDPVEHPLLADGTWWTDGRNTFDAPSPVVCFEADEDSNDYLSLSHMLNPTREEVVEREQESTETELIPRDCLPRLTFDGQAVLDGTHTYSAVYVEMMSKELSASAADRLQHAAKFDGSMNFAGDLLDGAPGPDEDAAITITEGRWFSGKWKFDGDTSQRHNGGYIYDGSTIYARKRREAIKHDGTAAFDGAHNYRWGQGTFEQSTKGAA